jgi:hypothetical protein
MHEVFVSYSRLDSPWVDAFVAALSHFKVDAWQDTRDIPVSAPWITEIHDAIQESLIFVACESVAQEGSVPCQTERAIAQELGKKVEVVHVGQDATMAAGQVRNALGGVTADEVRATELAIAARDWDRSGRKKGLLLGGRTRHRLERAPHNDDALVVTYLQESVSRGRRRLAAIGAGTLVTVVGALVASLLNGTVQQVNTDNSEQLYAYQTSTAESRSMAQDPYLGLEFASQSGGSASAALSLVIDQAMANPVPDGAFRVGGGAVRFADEPIGPLVHVYDRAGRLWSVPAGTRGRAAFPAAQGAAKSAGAPLRGLDRLLEVGIDRRTGIVNIMRSGAMYRRVTVPGCSDVYAVSPDGRWLAVATGTEVALVDMDEGAVRAHDVGAPGPVTALAWSAGSSRVWAISGGRIVTWPFTVGRRILDEPGQWFSALLPADNSRDVWVVTRAGLLLRVDVLTGRVVRTVPIDDTLLAAAGDPRGRDALLLGVHGLWRVNLLTGEASEVVVPGCVPGEPAFDSQGDLAAVGCAEQVPQVLLIDPATGHVEESVDVPGPGVSAVGFTPDGGLLVTSVQGDVLLMSPTARSFAQIEVLGAAPYVTYIAVSEKGSILPVGEGAGMLGTVYVGLPDGGNWTWNAEVDSPPIASAALAAAFDRAGNTFAIGYYDGTLVFRPTSDIEPSMTVNSISGGIRSMLTIGSTLYVATQTGELQAVPWCTACQSNAAMAALAGQRLDRAYSLGLTGRRTTKG